MSFSESHENVVFVIRLIRQLHYWVFIKPYKIKVIYMVLISGEQIVSKGGLIIYEPEAAILAFKPLPHDFSPESLAPLPL